MHTKRQRTHAPSHSPRRNPTQLLENSRAQHHTHFSLQRSQRLACWPAVSRWPTLPPGPRVSKEEEAEDDEAAEQEEQPREENLLRLLSGEDGVLVLRVVRRRDQLQPEQRGEDAQPGGEGGRRTALLPRVVAQQVLKVRRRGGVHLVRSSWDLLCSSLGHCSLAGRPLRDDIAWHRTTPRVDMQRTTAVNRNDPVPGDTLLANRARLVVLSQLEPLVYTLPAVKMATKCENRLVRGVQADVTVE
mmetsp:Transcript_32832/g.72093  ORF Transcript_32832/g.72093 Transcript_32832/m.72093 type:complete len:245 (-) Transcript_32832:81-815(-)